MKRLRFGCNASDKLEEFIRFCGEHGVRQGEMLGLPEPASGEAAGLGKEAADERVERSRSAASFR